MGNRDEGNPALARSLRALAQPWTLLLVLVLLLNDHLLRRQAPGWVTGKLGDVVWLAFAPLVVAVPLALLWPRSRDRKGTARRDEAVIAVAVALVGTVFAVVKALPAATAAFAAGFRALFGWAPLLVHDPTDLLTLPALAIAWLLYRGGRSAFSPPAGNTKGGAPVPRRALWVLALAALATLANAGPPDEGLLCVVAEEGRLIVGPQAGYGLTPTFVGDDGGFTWQAVPARPGIEEPRLCEWRTAPWTVEVPDEAAQAGRAQYRFTRGASIERSADGGATWVVDFDLTGDEARAAYYQATRLGISGYPGPHDAAVDPMTGNLVVAMGQEGVLVRRAGDGAWQWVAVGDYRFEPITQPGQVVAFLWGEFWFAAVAALVAFALCGWSRLRPLGRVVAVALGLGVVVALPMLRPATVSGYTGVIVSSGLIGLSVGALPLAIIAGVRLARGRGFGRAAALGSAAAALGAAPFILWALGVVATYTAAAWIAVSALTLLFVAAALTGND